ncbi:hypothetical protein H310_07163 [Aphanomyces invadans]|uniref:Uncharacterized protein n=1 Tax=Aphanomyces invadans TaxID=157072 RepID=A0A024U3V5_9STRA|nr:hypothetical protein H310_07163 [Aphanomyces invadans]ETW00587.1 hypothetical protein H310_07163 [Aphanomyces invadans]|eukprot:XP_008870722.1 hypothetical protein H310_07163 [Aphanomyces invadans]
MPNCQLVATPTQPAESKPISKHAGRRDPRRVEAREPHVMIQTPATHHHQPWCRSPNSPDDQVFAASTFSWSVPDDTMLEAHDIELLQYFLS